jgi:aminobenzoyl-glutamate utilization protein B
MATWGSGKPVIALGSDIDDIPQASQKPASPGTSRSSKARPATARGTTPACRCRSPAALAVKKMMEQQHLQGTLRLWPGVAEELLGTKAYYVRAGAFKDVDICIFAHVGANMNVGWGDSGGNGMVSVEYDFKGESAHAAGAPWRGRSALDAVELMDIGWNFRREHLRIQQRSHYVIPTAAISRTSSRRTRRSGTTSARPATRTSRSCGTSADTMAKAATMMTDTEVSMKVARLGLAGTLQQDRRRDDARQHREGRAADLERRGSDAGQGGCSAR